jgi:hypothetical protein
MPYPFGEIIIEEFTDSTEISSHRFLTVLAYLVYRLDGLTKHTYYRFNIKPIDFMIGYLFIMASPTGKDFLAAGSFDPTVSFIMSTS